MNTYKNVDLLKR